MNSYSTSNTGRSFASVGVTPYLRRVYSYLGIGVFLAVVGAFVALYAGREPVSGGPGEELSVGPIVAFGLAHPFLSMGGYMLAFFAASFARRVPGLNLLALFAYTFVTGLFLAPMLFLVQVLASHGQTLDSSPIRDAFLLSLAAFTGLTAYVFLSKKDFSFLGASLSVGIWVVLGASILAIFLHSAVFSLAIASAGVLLFAGYILYDTSQILRDRTEEDPIGAALRLFLDLVNLFVMLLRILSSQRGRS